MRLVIGIFYIVAQAGFVAAQTPPPVPGFNYPTSEKLRMEGYEVLSVIASMGGAAVVLKKGNVIYVCDLKPYTFNATGEEFFKGEKCQRLI